jgi:hypothetical protein
MGTYNQDFDSQFNFLKNQSKRVLYGCQPQTSRGQASRGSNSNIKQSTTSMNANQTRKYSKGSTVPRKNSNYAKEERYPVNNNQSYGKTMGNKNYDKAYKNAYASTASDSDSKEAYIQSELYGFKIVQSGRTIHDETGEDVDLFESDNEWPMTATNNEKFAASVLTIGPNVQEISLPSFA